MSITEKGTDDFNLAGTAFASYSQTAQKFLTDLKYAAYKGNPKNWQDVLAKWNLSADASNDIIEQKFCEMVSELKRVGSSMRPGEDLYFIEKLIIDYNMLRRKPGFEWGKTAKFLEQSIYNQYVGIESDNGFNLAGTAFASYSQTAQKFLTDLKYAAYKGNPKNWQDVLAKWNLSADASNDIIEQKFCEMVSELRRVGSSMRPGEDLYFIEKLIIDYNMLRTKPGFEWGKTAKFLKQSIYNQYVGVVNDGGRDL